MFLLFALWMGIHHACRGEHGESIGLQINWSNRLCLPFKLS